MTHRTHLDNFLRGRIIGRLEHGYTQQDVSEELGITQSVISRLWQRFQDDGHMSTRYSIYHLQVTTPNEVQYLEVTPKRNRLSTASSAFRHLSSTTVEHMWDVLGRQVEAHQPPLTCLPELHRGLRDE
ncbi:uncharacterized protein TNCV_2190961 [Trichonephila clavipes]|uniref:HTH cro/C1-type domain-containing protein n=1 Tax=Trichonephila clavipes TaxID=2585209 RepID=A0A8X6R5A8_TRICX|nr:uncharacterized protein TNCV_2190961 [Trichonephila clavipes]